MTPLTKLEFTYLKYTPALFFCLGAYIDYIAFVLPITILALMIHEELNNRKR